MKLVNATIWYWYKTVSFALASVTVFHRRFHSLKKTLSIAITKTKQQNKAVIFFIWNVLQISRRGLSKLAMRYGLICMILYKIQTSSASNKYSPLVTCSWGYFKRTFCWHSVKNDHEACNRKYKIESWNSAPTIQMVQCSSGSLPTLFKYK